MQINNSYWNGVNAANTQKTPIEPKGQSFKHVISEKETDLSLKELNQIIKDIDKHAQILVKHRTTANLHAYKVLIRKFIHTAIKNGTKMSDKKGNTPKSRHKTYKIVSIIDQKLMDLAEEILSNTQSTIEALSLIDEIKGLLINMKI